MQICTKEGRDLKVINDILYFYNAEDGHHYTKTYDEWICYPTNIDGTLDYNCMLYVEDVLAEQDTVTGQRVINFVDNCDSFLEIYARPLQIVIMQVRESTLEVTHS